MSRDGDMLQFVKKQNREMCLEAVESSGLAAVTQNGSALQYVKVQDIDICLATINQSGTMDYVEGRFINLIESDDEE